jgi:parvulin-like peptidyl-prolyl isomerase
MSHREIALILGVLLAGGGCTNRPGPGPLLPDYHFHSSPRGTDEARHVLVDRPQTLYDSVTVDLLNPNGVGDLIPQEASPDARSVTTVSAVASNAAREQLDAVPNVPVTMPTTGPATATSPRAHAARSSGTYETLGGVVVVVNNRPIYAEDVLKPLAKLLEAEAARNSLDGYKVIANKVIREQVMSMIRTELLVAQAEQVLDKSEKDLAWQLTMVWQQQQVANAGGSLEQAKARAAQAEAGSFDQMLEDKLRENKVKIYYQKKLMPRLQVTAQDIRDYYQRHLKDMFSEAEEIQFRLIKVAIKAAGREDALKKINDLKSRLSNGEDFQTLATQFNDDSRLAKNGGLEQPIARGAYVNEKVEQAAWGLQPGQISDVIQTPGAFYLVKVESRKPAHVRAFEDQEVQRQIDEILKKEQFGPMLAREQKKLLEAHPIDPDPPRFDLVLEMAMQMYPRAASAR